MKAIGNRQDDAAQAAASGRRHLRCNGFLIYFCQAFYHHNARILNKIHQQLCYGTACRKRSGFDQKYFYTKEI